MISMLFTHLLELQESSDYSMWRYNQTLNKKVGILGNRGSYHNNVFSFVLCFI